MTYVYVNDYWLIECAGEPEEVLRILNGLTDGFKLRKELVPEKCLSDRLLAVAILHLTDHEGFTIFKVAVTNPIDIKGKDTIFLNVLSDRSVACFQRKDSGTTGETVYEDATGTFKIVDMGVQHGFVTYLKYRSNWKPVFCTPTFLTSIACIHDFKERVGVPTIDDSDSA